jgi:hypothetical protein
LRVNLQCTLLLTIVWMMGLLLPASAMAHIVSANNLYEDIENLSAKEDIVFLTGINVIVYEHGSALFKPQDKLTRAELAHWVGAFYKLSQSEATAAEMAQLTVDKGLMLSLQGNATYVDVNQAFFAGKAQLDRTDEELTREQYATLMATYLATPINGQTLIEAAGYLPGPVGIVEAVDRKADGTTTLTIEDQQVQLAMHPRVLHASTDSSLWNGLVIGKSWMMETDEGVRSLQLLDFSNASTTEIADPSSNGINHDAHEAGHSTIVEEENPGSWLIPVILIVLIVLIVAWFTFNRLRRAR